MDLISKQAAIDAMAELQGRASTKAELKGISKAWKWIKKLPPVQPYTDEEIQKIQELEQAQLDKAFSLGREDAKPQWIPVAKRLPEDGGYYIVTENISEDGDKWVGLRWYSTVNGWKFEPVAWMPLPKPYQEEGEQE